MNDLLLQANKNFQTEISLLKECAENEKVDLEKDFQIKNLVFECDLKKNYYEKTIDMDKKLEDLKTFYETEKNELIRNFDKEKVEMKKSFDKEKKELKKNCDKEKNELRKNCDKEISVLKTNFYKEKNELRKTFEKEKKVLAKKQNDQS